MRATLNSSEAMVQRSILQWAAYQDHLQMFRINVIGIPIPGKPGRYRPSQQKGMADIYCTLMVEGLPIGIWFEVKNAKGRQTVSQKEFQKTITEPGGWYFIVRSIEQVEESISIVRNATWDKIHQYTPF